MNTCTNTLRNNVTRWWTQRKSLCSTCHSWSDKWSKSKAVADGKTALIKNEERQTERMQIFWKWRFKENVKNVSLGAGLDCDMLLFFLNIPVSFLSFVLPPSFFFKHSACFERTDRFVLSMQRRGQTCMSCKDMIRLKQRQPLKQHRSDPTVVLCCTNCLLSHTLKL